MISSHNASQVSFPVTLGNSVIKCTNTGLIQRLFSPTVRLRSELQAELQKSSVKTELNHQRARQQIEGSLSQEIESHTCPICYELMVPPQNAPILLFPCGMHSCASTSLKKIIFTARLCSLSLDTLLHHTTYAACLEVVPP